MNSINYVTSSEGKAASARRVFQPYGIGVLMAYMDLPEIQSFSVMRIAEAKARVAYDRLKTPLIVQDSGFRMIPWNGFPGALVKPVIEMMGIEGLLELNRSRPGPCQFEECMLYFDEKHTIFCLGYICGTLASEPRGVMSAEAWGNMWQIFIPDDQPGGRTQTIAEMSAGRRAKWRAKRKESATELFAKWYSSFLKGEAHVKCH